MPGAPHMQHGEPIAERTVAQIVWLFVVLPVVAGVGVLCHATWLVAAKGGRFTAGDWLGIVWYGLLGLGLLTALPAAGCQELRRRRRLRDTWLGRPRPGSNTRRTRRRSAEK